MLYSEWNEGLTVSSDPEEKKPKQGMKKDLNVAKQPKGWEIAELILCKNQVWALLLWGHKE